MDPVTIFTSRFQKTDEGYLFFPTEKSGGKLVTEEEYERALADWVRVGGKSGIWRAVACLVMLILVWMFAENRFGLPHWWGNVVVIGGVASAMIWFIWWSWAPRRITKNRPFIAAPRFPVSDR
ncbi:hypothetical protein [Novosphingobium naphthalenivorans]|uniref:hypothetical protein n=1 Tax=Novosphingobium naphthalenivorans TaxID=273168 RepID=UPI0012EE5455|nr:hypothetical protein [Novosphingobium naphthalenivorans]